MKGLTLGCVNMMNGKRLVMEKITKKKRKRKRKWSRCEFFQRHEKKIMTIKLRKLERIRGANNAYNSFFSPKNGPGCTNNVTHSYCYGYFVDYITSKAG